MSLRRQIINSSKYSKILLAICLIAGDEPDKGKQLENYVLFKQKQQNNNGQAVNQQRSWLGRQGSTTVPVTTLNPSKTIGNLYRPIYQLIQQTTEQQQFSQQTTALLGLQG